MDVVADPPQRVDSEVNATKTSAIAMRRPTTGPAALYDNRSSCPLKDNADISQGGRIWERVNGQCAAKGCARVGPLGIVCHRRCLPANEHLNARAADAYSYHRLVKPRGRSARLHGRSLDTLFDAMVVCRPDGGMPSTPRFIRSAYRGFTAHRPLDVETSHAEDAVLPGAAPRKPASSPGTLEVGSCYVDYLF
jgi:hypothetical protein